MITIDGNVLPPVPQRVVIMLHKPRSYVTTLSDEHGRKTAAQLIDIAQRVYPIGRLDMQSEGLLLFTNDGALANRLMHPSKQIDKVYEVTVTGAGEDGAILLRRSILLDGRRITPPAVVLLDQRGEKSIFRVTIHEGRNRQIRRMCEAAQMQVLRLKRVQEGAIFLGNLPCGQWRYLTPPEIKRLEEER